MEKAIGKRIEYIDLPSNSPEKLAKKYKKLKIEDMKRIDTDIQIFRKTIENDRFELWFPKNGKIMKMQFDKKKYSYSQAEDFFVDRLKTIFDLYMPHILKGKVH